MGNPAAAGATLSIAVHGGTPSSQTFTLPMGTSALTGKPFWSGDAVKGFKYKDSKGENGPVKVAQLKKSGGGVFQLKAVAVGKLGAIAVVPPNFGTDAACGSRSRAAATRTTSASVWTGRSRTMGRSCSRS